MFGNIHRRAVVDESDFEPALGLGDDAAIDLRADEAEADEADALYCSTQPASRTTGSQ